jgi:hypothetical protein
MSRPKLIRLARTQIYLLEKDGNMATSFQRLRESKLIADVRAFEHGRTLGVEWALEHAEFDDLERLNVVLDEPSCIEQIADVLGICSDCLVGDIAPEHWFSEPFARGFESGVLSVFAQAFPDAQIMNPCCEAFACGAA